MKLIQNATYGPSRVPAKSKPNPFAHENENESEYIYLLNYRYGCTLNDYLRVITKLKFKHNGRNA